MTLKVDFVSATTLLPDSGTVTRLMTSVAAVRAHGPVDVRITALESPRLLTQRRLVEKRRRSVADHGASISFRPLAPQRLPGGRPTMVRLAGVALTPGLRARRPDVLFAVNADAAAACAQARGRHRAAGINVLEMHGLESEEAIVAGTLRRDSPAHAGRLSIERRALCWADDVVAPTTEACAWGEALTPGPTRWHDLPTLSPLRLDEREARDLRAASRERLGWSNKKVLLYTGGMNEWQQPELMASVFGSLRSIDPDWRFLVLSPDRAKAEKILLEAGVGSDELHVLTVAHDQVAMHATAGDVALLLRRRHLMNHVASPTKFGEYLEMGVPVCTTDALPAMARLTTELGLGIVVDHDAAGAEVAQRIERFAASADRRAVAVRCRAAAAEHFAQRRADAVYGEILGTVRTERAS